MNGYYKVFLVENTIKGKGRKGNRMNAVYKMYGIVFGWGIVLSSWGFFVCMLGTCVLYAGGIVLCLFAGRKDKGKRGKG